MHAVLVDPVVAVLKLDLGARRVANRRLDRPQVAGECLIQIFNFQIPCERAVEDNPLVEDDVHRGRRPGRFDHIGSGFAAGDERERAGEKEGENKRKMPAHNRISISEARSWRRANHAH